MEKIAMKKSRFTEEQVTYALRQAEGGTAVEDICRSLGISQATFYIWKKKYGSLVLVKYVACANWKMKMPGLNGS